jgi:hypothetical protein
MTLAEVLQTGFEFPAHLLFVHCALDGVDASVWGVRSVNVGDEVIDLALLS